MNAKLFIHLLIVVLSVNLVSCLKILGLFPFKAKSHYYMFRPYIHELARKGHEVIIASHHPEEDTTRIKHINLSRDEVSIEFDFPVEVSYRLLVKIIQFVKNGALNDCDNLLKADEIHSLIRKKAKFDVIVTELFNSDCSLGIAYKLDAPVVGIVSSSLFPHTYNRFGIPSNPSFLPSRFGDGGSKPTFYQRLETFVLYRYLEILFKLNQIEEQKMLAKHYPDIPSLEDLGRNIKFVLVNQYFTLKGTSLDPSNMIEVAGLHVAQPKPLPNDITKFIDEAEHGVIYVSFGSVAKTSSLPKEKLEILLSAFKELPQRILWKWEADELPGKPKNVLIKKWMPQNDILAHPNVRAFFSHSGMMGTIEAVTHGVPVVSMPIHGDQLMNAALIRERGFGVTVHYNEMTKEKIIDAINTVMSDKFKKQALEHSDMFKNRPVSPMETAIFWTEFAAKHPNISFTAPSATVPTYQYYLLDIYASFAAIILLFYWIFKSFFFSKRASIPKQTKSRLKEKKC